MKKEEFDVKKLPLGDTRKAAKMLNDMFAESYVPFLTTHTGADLTVLFRVQRKPGRPTDKVPANENEE